MWLAGPGQRTGRNKAGCSVCANRTVLVGYNDLSHTHPEIAAMAFGWDPTTVVAGNSRKHEWRCEKGHHWLASVNNRTSAAKTGCPICANLAHTHPDIAVEAHGWDPTTVLPASHLKQLWRCRKDHVWPATIASRTNAASGCPSCAQYGFDPNKPGWLYFLRHPRWGMLQVGITNVPKSRLRQHELRGWVVLELEGPMAGDAAYRKEQGVLRALRSLGVPLGPREVAGAFSGYTESWIEETFPARALETLLQLTKES